jgi:DNA repair ATPase RecN
MDRKSYIDSLGRKLKSWDKDIAKLEKQADKITKKLQQQIEELKQHREHAAAKTTDLVHSSEKAWQEVKYGAEEAMSDLKKAFRKARSKFR